MIAVDLGATSGRVMQAEIGPGVLRLAELHRFANELVLLPDGLHWDVLRLYREILAGLALAARTQREYAAVAIDSWAVDYGLLDAGGALLGNPYHYRDRRTDGVAERLGERISPTDLYQLNGLQVLPLNTIYQLAAMAGRTQLGVARTLLLIPDLINHWLCGYLGAEVTNASTTGLLDVRERVWSSRLTELAGIPADLLPRLHQPGAVLASLRSEVQMETGLTSGTLITATGSHDTASAAAAVPAEHERFAFVSCGTWALVGVELPQPVLTNASRIANFTNELGIDGWVRYLRNVTGLWLLEECLRAWSRTGLHAELTALLAAAAVLPTGGPVIDVDDPSLNAPGHAPGMMPERIVEACRRTGQQAPSGQAAIVRCLLDSLARAFASMVWKASRLSGRRVEVVHLVGGGARNALLCQLTANACGLPVVSGPVEATSLGNVLVQARALGAINGDLYTMRALVRATQTLTRYDPR